MKLQVEISIFCIISLIWAQEILCDGLSDTSGVNKWTCTCSSAYQGNQNFSISTNCSSSCDCSPAAAGSSGNKWICICAADGFPKLATDGHDTTCFTACSCNSGSSSGSQSSKKRISSKVVVIIILACIVFTTLGFVASVICYAYRREKCPIQLPLFSSDKDTSCNSATNLISHRASSSVSESKAPLSSPSNTVTGCIRKASFLFRGKTERTQGTIIQFSYSELQNATSRFSDSNLRGTGGSSRVYCGVLKDGRTVAIKRIKTQGGPDAESIFLTEIELISRLHHCNLVRLLGYCSEYQGKHAERLIVFEYIPNGNLRECLDGASGICLDWGSRITIALGAARGLEYLHEAAAPKILHRDVKSTNILLDENWRAKITDLGMAKRFRTDGVPSCSSSPARMQGTFGYFAPECVIIGRASPKSDVFSFGVVLLELISGRQPIQKSANKGEESLVIWATPRLQDSRRVILELPDPHLNGNFLEEEMQIMAYMAKECLLLDPDSRPTMSDVVHILSTIAPDKSRRRNFPVNLFQSSSTRDIKCEIDIERPDKQVQDPVEVKDFRRITSNKWSPRCSLPLNIDPRLYAEHNGNEFDAPFSEYIERLILLTSNARSWRSKDDEVVDLTEPRFEAFCMTNDRSTGGMQRSNG